MAAAPAEVLVDLYHIQELQTEVVLQVAQEPKSQQHLEILQLILIPLINGIWLAVVGVETLHQQLAVLTQLVQEVPVVEELEVTFYHHQLSWQEMHFKVQVVVAVVPQILQLPVVEMVVLVSSSLLILHKYLKT